MCAVHPWAVDRCTAFLTSCSLHSRACTHMHTCTHIHISWHDVIKCCHPTWGDKTSNSKGVNIHPNIWMFKLLTKNASICQNSNHQRETKSSSLAQWALFVFQNRLWPFSVPAFSMSPGWSCLFQSPSDCLLPIRAQDLWPDSFRWTESWLAGLSGEKAEAFWKVLALPENQFAQLNHRSLEKRNFRYRGKSNV